MNGLSSFLSRYNFVKQIPIFSKLNWFEQQKVARKARIVEYKKGEIIAKEGNPPDFFYCLLSGRLQVFVERDGHKRVVDFIHRGMHFGVISVLTGENHSLSYEAINDTVALQIPKEDFNAILKAIPHLGVELSQVLSKRLRSQVKGQKNIFESSIIAFYSPVKGTGSSTFAVNLAVHMQHETKKKVIFVNIQPRNVEGEKSPLEVVDASPHWKKQPIELNDIFGEPERLQSAIEKDMLNIHVINVTFDSKDPSIRKEIAPFVSALVGDYHYVIVDLPNDMDEVVMETLTQSDQVLLITNDRRKDLEQIKHVIENLKTALKEGFRHEKIKIVIRAAQSKVYLSFEEINKFIGYDVYGMLPYINPSDLKEKIKTNTFQFLKAEEGSDYNQSVKRIAREIGGVMVGIVLGGGAALGVAHIGVIRVLEREKIPIDMIIGSSMGALVGSMWSIGRNAKELEEIAREFQKSSNMLKLFDPPIIPISGLLRGGLISRWLRKHLGNKTFYSTKIPFKAVSYDLIHREEHVINSGSLVDAVRQSIAIPGVIKPVIKGDQVIIDGGVLNPLPTNVLSSLGIKKIIAINVLQSPLHVADGYDMQMHHERELDEIPFAKRPFYYVGRRILKLIGKPFNPNIADIIVRTLQASEYVIAEQSARLADIVIHPNLTGINWFELYKVDELIQRGEEATLAKLDQIKQLIAE